MPSSIGQNIVADHIQSESGPPFLKMRLIFAALIVPRMDLCSPAPTTGNGPFERVHVPPQLQVHRRREVTILQQLHGTPGRDFLGGGKQHKRLVVGVVRADADEVVELASEAGFPFGWRWREEGAQGWRRDGFVHDLVLEPRKPIRVSLIRKVVSLRSAVYRSYNENTHAPESTAEDDKVATHGYSQQ